MYIQERKILGVFVSDVRASGFRASGGLEPRVLALPKNNNDNALSLSLKKCNEIMQYQYYVGKNNALSLVMHYFWNFRYDIFRSFYLRKKYFK